MRLGKFWVAFAATAVAITLTGSTMLPVVTYSTLFTIPKNYDDKAFVACVPSASNTTAYQSCLDSHLLPPVALEGRASATYYLAGYGSGPYPAVSLVTQGNRSALVYWKGSSIAMAEELDHYPYGKPPVLLPPGTIHVTDVRMTPSSNGLIDFTATVYGLPADNLSQFHTATRLYFDYPGYGANSTFDGVTWHSHPFEIPCGGSSGACVANRMIGTVSGLQENATYKMTVVVAGYVSAGSENTTETLTGNGGTTTVATFQFPELREFLYVQTLDVRYPGSGVNEAWVNDFMNIVGTDRGAAWTFEPALDGFAQLRFSTDVSNYQISDYGFQSQASAYFNGTGKVYNEEILYPGTFSPSGFALYLQAYAPGHWAGLMNTGFSQYGFYIGAGPSVSFLPPCSVTEITGTNENITQVAIQNGCKYQVVSTIYLVLVLTD